VHYLFNLLSIRRKDKLDIAPPGQEGRMRRRRSRGVGSMENQRRRTLSRRPPL